MTLDCGVERSKDRVRGGILDLSRGVHYRFDLVRPGTVSTLVLTAISNASLTSHLHNADEQHAEWLVAAD